MQLLFTSPSLEAPTVDTLRSYASERFQNLVKYLPKFTGEYSIRISVSRERHLFMVSVEVSMPQPLIVKVRDKDLRRALDQAYAVLKRSVVKSKRKKYKL